MHQGNLKQYFKLLVRKQSEKKTEKTLFKLSNEIKKRLLLKNEILFKHQFLNALEKIKLIKLLHQKTCEETVKNIAGRIP